ncbi:hypothetical protein EDD99_0404 [Streptomyces sp. 846.5]|nr:hypothetical protein EDD99_0404 [Streptomyces sp. 846.5]
MRLNRRQALGTTGALLLICAMVCGALWMHGDFAGPTVSYIDYEGTVLVGADGRTLTVGGDFGACDGKTVQLDAQESTRQVALRLRRTIPPAAQRHVGECSVSSAQAVSGRLRAPLGARTLVDAANGSPLAWFDGGRALEPAALAPDWIPFRSSPLIAYQTSLRILTGCTQVWISHTQPGTLTLVQAVGGLSDLAVTDAYNRAAPVRVRVHGHIGIAAGSRIEWTEGDRVLLLTGERAGKPWSPAELLAIADTTP